MNPQLNIGRGLRQNIICEEGYQSFRVRRHTVAIKREEKNTLYQQYLN